MANTNITTRKYEHRPLEALNLMDDFLFQELLSQKDDCEEFCRIFLSTILGKSIHKVRIVPQKSILGIDTQYKINALKTRLYHIVTVPKKSFCIQREQKETLAKNCVIC